MIWLLVFSMIPMVILDWKYHKVNVRYEITVLGVLLVLQIIFPVIQGVLLGNWELLFLKYISILERLLPSMGLSAAFYCLCLLSHGQIGLGDGLTVVLFAAVLYIQELLLLLLISFGIVSVAGMVMIIFCRCGRKTRIPFVPIMYISCLTVILFRFLGAFI